MNIIYLCSTELTFKIRTYKTKGEYHAKGRDFDSLWNVATDEHSLHDLKQLVSYKNKLIAKAKKILSKGKLYAAYTEKNVDVLRAKL